LDSDAAPRRAAAGPRHGGRARRPPAPTTPAGPCAAGYAVVLSSPPPALDRPEGSASAPTMAAWCRAGRGEDRTREALRRALEVRDAAPHQSRAHCPGADSRWPPADPQPAAPPRGARVARRDLSAVSALDPRQTRAAAAPAAREPGRAAGPSPPWPRGPAPACRRAHALPRAALLPGTPATVSGWPRPAATPCPPAPGLRA